MIETAPEAPAQRGNKQRRHVYIPIALAERLSLVEDRINVSVAACSGIEAMVRAAEADPNFSMPQRQDETCDHGHVLSRINKIRVRGVWYCRPCRGEGRLYRTPEVAA